jgi:hypothetical protein
MPRIVCRVVWGRLEVIATFSPTSALVSVDLPVLGRPTRQANPDRCGTTAGVVSPVVVRWLTAAILSLGRRVARACSAALSLGRRSPGRRSRGACRSGPSVARRLSLGLSAVASLPPGRRTRRCGHPCRPAAAAAQPPRKSTTFGMRRPAPKGTDPCRGDHQPVEVRYGRPPAGGLRSCPRPAGLDAVTDRSEDHEWHGDDQTRQDLSGRYPRNGSTTKASTPVAITNAAKPTPVPSTVLERREATPAQMPTASASARRMGGTRPKGTPSSLSQPSPNTPVPAT